VIFHPDGQRLIISDDSGLGLWPIESDHVQLGGLRIGARRSLDLPIKMTPERACLSRDGRTLVALDGSQGQVIVLDLEKKLGPRSLPKLSHVAAAAIHPDGRWVATSTWKGSGTKIWDARTGDLVAEPQGGDAHLAFSPDGRWLATCTIDECRLWEVESWRAGPRFAREPGGNIGHVAFSPDGSLLALSHSIRLVKLIDPSTAEVITSLATPEGQAIVSLCFSPDNERLAVAYSSQTVQIWDLRLVRKHLAEIGLDWSSTSDRASNNRLRHRPNVPDPK